MFIRGLQNRSSMAGMMLAMLISPAAKAGDSETQPTAANAAVIAALRAELDHDNDTRRERLSQALASDPELPAAHWQSGAVQTDQSAWDDFHEASSANRAMLAAYEEVRSQTAAHPADLLELADWCREYELSDVERAHLLQVLEQEPEHAAARERLGDVKWNGQWISSEDIQRALARQTALGKSLESWGPTIAESVRLLAGVRKQRDRGHEQLFAIREISAIPAMEYLLAREDEPSGLILVEWLARLNACEAGQSLARTALVSPHNSVRLAAAEALRSRRYDEYVPVLLSALKTPVKSKSRTYVNSDGWVVLDMLFDSETQHERRELQVSTQVGKQIVIRPTGVTNTNGSVRWSGFQEGPDLPDWLAVRRYLLQQERQREGARLELNDRILTINGRAEYVLKTSTQTQLTGPQDWWTWWDQFNEVHLTMTKPSIRVQAEPERVYVRDRDKELTDRRPPPKFIQSAGGLTQGSCLVAGTPVWTEQGLLPVERVQVGDRVLAQDLGSGELAYKPVIATTVRPPVRTFRIATGDIELRATGGHPFWVNGDGWRFARDLKPGMSFHGTDGARPITSVEPAGDAQAFNLIVADFHTYFIGSGQILSHDNTPRDPTNALVPGLSREP